MVSVVQKLNFFLPDKTIAVNHLILQMNYNLAEYLVA